MRMFCCRKNASAAALRSDGFRGRRSTSDEENSREEAGPWLFPQKRLEILGRHRKKGRSARQAKSRAKRTVYGLPCSSSGQAHSPLPGSVRQSSFPFPPGDRRLPRKAHCRNFPSGNGIFKRKKGRVMSAALKRRKAPDCRSLSKDNLGIGLLSHVKMRSIMGDEALNFRVRNGIGCTRFSMDTKEIFQIYN